MAGRKLIVYSGPTISPSDILRCAPEAEVRRPIGAGDVWERTVRRGDVYVIIDGYFYSQASVRHKELTYLLDSGAIVIGAASLGALRAAELHSLGMDGVGVVYRWFRSGVLNGDDEVAVLHGPVETGYEVHTIALVNLRWACSVAQRRGVLDERSSRLVIGCAKDMPFFERTWDNITDDIRSRAVIGQLPGPEQLQDLQHILESRDGRLKWRDAIRAVKKAERLIRQQSLHPERLVRHSRTRAPETYYVQRWRFDHGPASDVTRAPDEPSRSEIVLAAQLFLDDYPKLHTDVLERLLRGGQSDQSLEDNYSILLRRLLGVRTEPLPDSLERWLTARESMNLSLDEKLLRIAARTWTAGRCGDWRPAVYAELETQGWLERCSELASGARCVRESKDSTEGAWAYSEQQARLVFAGLWKADLKRWLPEIASRGFVSTGAFGAIAPWYVEVAQGLTRNRQKARGGALR